MIELELTYLLKYIPENLKQSEKLEMLDIYIPTTSLHPGLRLRKQGQKYEITKKRPIDSDVSKQRETTVPLTADEFEELSQVTGKRVRKDRYLYLWNGFTAEIDIFLEQLEGLAVVEFEFQTEEEKDNFTPPDFCLVEITQEEFIAGGFVAGKSYQDIVNDLKRYNYEKIIPIQ